MPNRDTLLSEWSTLIDGAEREQRALTRGESARIDEIEQELRTADAPAARPYQVPESQRGSAPSGADTRDASWFDVRALSSGSDAAGGYFVPHEQSRQFIDRLMLQAPLLGQLQRVSMASDTLVLPGVASDMTASWVAEGQQMTPSDAQYKALTLRAYKVAGYTLASAEVFMDSSPSLQQIVRQQLERSVALALETAFFEGTGISQPTALKNVPDIETITTLGADGGVPTNFDCIADAVAELISNGARAEALVAYMHPRTWKTLSKMKTGVASSQQTLMQLEQGGATAAPVRTIYGVPVYFSGAISVTETQGNNSDCSSIYVFDPARVVFASREYVRVEASNAVKFDHDQIAIKCVARADFGVLNPGAVARIVGVRA